VSGLLLYCIAPAGHAPKSMPRGVGGTTVRAVQIDGLSAWVSPAERPPAVDMAAVRAHHEVIESSNTREVTTLPVRFGQCLESEDVLRARLLANRAEYAKALELVRGALEFSVRVVPLEMATQASGPQATEVTSGRAYMDQLASRASEKRAHARRGEEIASELRSVVGTHMVRERVETLDPEAGLVSIAHLVRRADFEAYTKAVHSVSARHADARFHLSGPWPPYSFAA
jgi:hypothetical protein